MKRLVKLVGIIVSAFAAVLTLSSVSMAANPDTLVNNWNWKCLEIDGSSKSNGARAQMWDCRGQAGAVWRFENQGGWYRIINVNSGKCLEIADSRTDNGAPAQQWSCSGGDTQRWGFAGGQIFNKNSQKVLEIDGGSDANGARVQQWQNANKTWQAWSYGTG